MSRITRRVLLGVRGLCLKALTAAISRNLTRLLAWVIQRSWQLITVTMKITSGLQVSQACVLGYVIPVDTGFLLFCLCLWGFVTQFIFTKTAKYISLVCFWLFWFLAFR